MRLGEVGGGPFHLSGPQLEYWEHIYWEHIQLIFGVVPSSDGMFSLEDGEGVRFLIRSRVFTDAEYAQLQADGRV